MGRDNHFAQVPHKERLPRGETVQIQNLAPPEKLHVKSAVEFAVRRNDVTFPGAILTT